MLFLLDKDVRTVKWNGFPLHEANSAIVKEETNGDFYLTVRYPITDSGIYQFIKEDMLIKAPVPVLGAQLFRIKKPIENDDSLDITAYHVSDDIMKRSITPVSVVGQGCAMALSQMVQNAKTGLGDFSFTSDIMDSRTFNTTETETLYSVLMDGKHSIVGTWEGELVRDNFALSIKRSRGADRGVVITTHKNLKSYQRTKNSQGVVTRIHARSTFKPDGAEDEVTLRVTVDSPLINSYPYINEKEYENNNAETVEDLRKWAEAKFTNEGIDKVSDAIEIEAYELDGQVVHLGDTVNLKSRKHSADLYKKAIAYEFNALTEEYISITFDDKPGVGGSGVSSGLSNAADAILGASATAQDVAVKRAVKNANAAFDAEFDKRAEKIYDGIEQSKAAAEVYADAIKEEIVGQMAESDRQYQAQKMVQDAQIAEILEQSGNASKLIEEAKLDASSAHAKAAEALLKTLANTDLINETKADLKVTADAIKALVTKEDFDATTKRLTIAETEIEAQAGLIKQRLTSTEVEAFLTKNGYATSATVQNIVKQTADSFSRTISRIESQIPTSVGGTNLFKGSWDFSGEWYNSTNGSFHEEHKGVHIQRTNREWSGKSQKINAKAGEVYTFSFYAKSDTENDSVTFYANHTNTGSPAQVNPISKPISLTNEYRRYSVTFKALSDGIIVPRIERTNSANYLYFGGFKLENGTISTDWSPSPEDLSTVVALNEVRDTVESHTQTLTNQSGQISQVVQTAQGLVARVSAVESTSDILSRIQNGKSLWSDVAFENSLPSVYNNAGGTTVTVTKRNLSTGQPAGRSYVIEIQTKSTGSVSPNFGGINITNLPAGTFRNNGEYVIRWTAKLPVGKQFNLHNNMIGTGAIYKFLSDNKGTGNWQTYTAYCKMGATGGVSSTHALSFISVSGGSQETIWWLQDFELWDISQSGSIQAMETRVSTLAGSWAVQHISSAGDILAQANLSPAQFLLEASKIRLKGKTLADEIQAIDGKFNKLFVADGTFGKLNANVIGANSITGDKMVVDQSFINKFAANEAYLKQLFAKSAFITSVQSVKISASQITGGLLRATNGAAEFNLNAGQILYYTDQAALKRILSGYPTQFVKFATGLVDGKKVGVTVIGSNRYGTESSNDGGFVGTRAWNGDGVDILDLVGDEVRIASAAYEAADGWSVSTLPGKLEIDAYRTSDRFSSRVKVGDVWLWGGPTTYSSLKETLNLIIDNLALIHANKTTENSYSYTLPSKV